MARKRAENREGSLGFPGFNCRKEDLRIVALELGETVAGKVPIVELTEIIKENKYFKEDVEFVKELIHYTIEDRKKAEEDRKRVEEYRKKEAENRLREKELQLELARLNVRVNSDNERTIEACNSLHALVKSVRILTVKVPNIPESWAFFFFSSIEKEVTLHISVRAGNDWFRPLELAKEIDLYNTSRGKSLKPLPNVLTRNNPVKNASRAADNLELSIKKFWEIENVEIDSVKTSELDICEDHFKNTYSRDDQGRYTVAMPLKEDPACLGESRQTAIQRLNSLWKRLSGGKEYLSLYEKFLQEY
ncbi:DUF5641 domain-containing protein [Trichonephila clavipes]|nr:DUF5641 domain-containing protein [Trichonephila clavipes]